MKSLKKQFMAAIAMTLVAALAVGSSTYAWFSMNTAVTASGMSVQAKTDGGLAIGAYTESAGAAVAPDANAFASAADAVYDAAAEIYPTSTKDAKTWYTAESADANDYQASESPEEVAAADVGDYRLRSRFQIKSLDTATDDANAKLYVTSVSVSKTTAAKYSASLDKALRVCIVVDTNAYFFAPLYEEDATLYYWTGTERAKYGDTGKNTINLNTAAKKDKLNVEVSSTLSTSAKDVDVYVYYEGEDGNCMSVNAANISELNVSVDFSTEQVV